MINRSLLTAALAAFLAAPAFAGDPVPGVDVLLEQIPGGAIYVAHADADGNMIFDELPPGQYRVFQQIEHPTFTVPAPATTAPADGDGRGSYVVVIREVDWRPYIVARPVSAADVGRIDGRPMAAESLNSARSNTGNEIEVGDIPVDNAAVRRLLQSNEVQRLIVPNQSTEPEDDGSNDN